MQFKEIGNTSQMNPLNRVPAINAVLARQEDPARSWPGEHPLVYDSN